MTKKKKLKIKDTETLIRKDIKKRQKLGIKKYGTTVAQNKLSLREWLQHAYEEQLDDIVYLKRAIQQIDHEEKMCLKFHLDSV